MLQLLKKDEVDSRFQFELAFDKTEPGQAKALDVIGIAR
jgi:hypothetical protein